MSDPVHPMRWLVGPDQRIRPLIDGEMITRGARGMDDRAMGALDGYDAEHGHTLEDLAEACLRAALQEPKP